jgi:hypothetical protein
MQQQIAIAEFLTASALYLGLNGLAEEREEASTMSMPCQTAKSGNKRMVWCWPEQHIALAA